MDSRRFKKFPALINFSTKQRELLQKWIKNKINYDDERRGYPYSFHKDVSFYDCRLCPTQHIKPYFCDSYADAVLDKSLTNQLEKCKTLNWCPSLVKLEAVAVPQDGNSLLHAASFAMWSVHDEHFTLRELLLLAMTINRNDSYKQRWWRQKLLDLKALKDESKIISQEWEEVVRSISSLNKASIAKSVSSEFLESVHIYVLSNILRRPIIIVTDQDIPSSGCNAEEDSQIAGIYLPLEWIPIKCCKTPLILGYSQGKFCPLLSEVAVRPNKKDLLFPLVTRDFCSLPVRFLNQLEEHRASELIQRYFIVKEASIPMGTTGEAPAPCSLLNYKDLPPEMSTVVEHFKLCEHLKYQLLAQGGQSHGHTEARLLQQLHNESQTKVAPMRSFSESYHMSQRNQAGKEIGQAQRYLMSEEKAAEEGLGAVGGFNSQGYASRGKFCEPKAEHMSEITKQLEQTVVNQTGTAAGAVVNSFGTANAAYTVPTAPPASGLFSLEEPLSMLDERCQNKCGYRCSKQTYPYCHECFNLTAANQQVRCGSEVCSYEKGLSFLGVAPFHINDINDPQGNLMLFSPSPPQSVGNPLACSSLRAEETQEKKDNSKYQEHSKVPKSPSSQTTPLLPEGRNNLSTNQKRIMQPIPERVRKIIHPVNDQELNRMAMSERKQDGEEDCNVICVSAESPVCVSPYCKETVSSPNMLCDNCQAVLLRAQRYHNPEMNASATLGNVVSERSLQLQAQKLNQIQTGQKDSLAFQRYQEQKIRQQWEMRSRQIGKPCVSPGCVNYGDPVHADMCSSCYNRLAVREYEKLKREHTRSRNDKKAKTEIIGVVNQYNQPCFAPSSSSHNEASRPVKANTVNLPVSAFVTNKSSVSVSPGSRGSLHGSLDDFATFDINAFNQGFVHEYEKFRDQSASGLKKCKMPACTNYGNFSKGGFCNSCYADKEKKRDEERIAMFGENVPDCWSSQQNSI
ncbi:tumor necrosis factor, alpha-induced protein 3 [Elysia marginata]|uniref:Tumor necrosis factor, alpha-induced protein 3 n=1 Tax=Elysia marginata TaxID=1093978 RepID=A0AAV4IRJ7_9GAST|nr:tumor necrosis factor, alpha-induced protein 3 [Elysia marginata]